MAPNAEVVFTNEYLHTVYLKDQNNKIFYDKLTYIYVEFPKFKKTEAELVTHQDKWLYIFKNLATLQEVPITCHEPVFEYIFDKATVANFTADEHAAYLASSLALSDYANTINTAKREGKVEGKIEGLAEGEEIGLQKGKQEIAIEMLRDGDSIEKVARCTHLPTADIISLKQKYIAN